MSTSGVSRLTQVLTQEYVSRWWQCSADAPQVGRTYTVREQAERESLLDDFVKTTSATLKQPLRTDAQRREVQQQLTALGALFAKTALDFEDAHLQAVEQSGIMEAAVAFVQQARRYDAALSSDDIYQAARNAMTMNLLQLLMGLPVGVTPSIFAYSMLYPYTDNYLDDPSLSRETKQSFNVRFARRLQGALVTPANAYEQKISDMVGMIEGQYERARYPQVYASLLDIHQAQARSMRLHQRNASPFDVDVLGLSFEKGGAAVLADAYLVAGTPTQRQLDVCFGYGAFTQLMDDLEDVEQDRRDGILTLFSSTAPHWSLDIITSRLFYLGDWVLARIDDVGVGGPAPLREVMQRCIRLLLADSVGSLARYYTPSYLAGLEAQMPFRFSALKKQRQRMSRQRTALMKFAELSTAAQPGGLPASLSAWQRAGVGATATPGRS